MRTTLTLDEDVAARLAAEARRSGRSFKETVNVALRAGLDARRHRSAVTRFRVAAKDLGAERTQLGLDSIAKLIEEVDGAGAR